MEISYRFHGNILDVRRDIHGCSTNNDNNDMGSFKNEYLDTLGYCKMVPPLFARRIHVINLCVPWGSNHSKIEPSCIKPDGESLRPRCGVGVVGEGVSPTIWGYQYHVNNQ